MEAKCSNSNWCLKKYNFKYTGVTKFCNSVHCSFDLRKKGSYSIQFLLGSISTELGTDNQNFDRQLTPIINSRYPTVDTRQSATYKNPKMQR